MCLSSSMKGVLGYLVLIFAGTTAMRSRGGGGGVSSNSGEGPVTPTAAVSAAD